MMIRQLTFDKILNKIIFLLVVTYGISYFNSDLIITKIASYGKWAMLFISIVILMCILKNTGFKYKKLSTITLLVLILFSVSMISAIKSDYSSISVATMFAIFIPMVFVILLNYSFDIVDININKIFYTGVITVVVIALVLGYKDIINSIINYKEIMTFTGRLRIKGLFEHPNSLGSVSCVGTYCLYESIKDKFTKWKLIGIIFLLVTIIISNSRTPIVAFGIIFVIDVILRGIANTKRKVIKQWHFIIFCTIAIAGFIGLFLFLKSYWDTPLDTLDSVSVRTGGWRYIVEYTLKDNWSAIFGHGLSSTGAYMTGGIQALGVNTDNSFIILFYQLGLSSIFLLICLLFYFLNDFIKQKSNITNTAFRAGLLVSILIYATFENMFFAWGNLITIYFWYRMFHKSELISINK